MITIRVSPNETYWINSKKKIPAKSRGQYKITSKIIGKKGIFRSCYFVIFLLDNNKKEIARKWRWITDFSGIAKNYEIIFTTDSKTKYLSSGYRVNIETERKGDVELVAQELHELKFEEIPKKITNLFDNRPDYVYPKPNAINQSKLFIIIGINRSGTTILMQVLQTFEGCFGNPIESRDYEGDGLSLYRFVKKSNDFHPLENFILKNWKDEYFIEKATSSLFCLPQLHKKYPLANYIFLERNPLKILLSQLNYLSIYKEGPEFRTKLMEQGIIEKEDLPLTVEVFHSKLILNSVKFQKNHKPLFKNQITIRYENFVENFEHNIQKIEKKFGLTPNIALAKKVFSKPSVSSINNNHIINSICEEQAIKNITEAKRLWDYQ